MSITQQAKAAIDLGRGGSYSLSRDVIKHCLYDTILVGTTAIDRTLFTTQVGTAYGAGTKSINETNMQDSGKLPAGQNFLIQKMGISLVSVFPAAGANADDLIQAYMNYLQGSVVEIRIAGREYDFQCPGCEFVPAVPVTGTASAANVARAGDTIASGTVSLGATPIFVDNLVTFSVVLRSGSGLAAIQTILDANAALLQAINAQIRVKLEGILTRAK